MQENGNVETLNDGVENEATNFNDNVEAARPGPVQPKKNHMTGGSYCCVTSCRSRKGREKIGFFKVKRANEKRTLDWAIAIDRKNQFGGLWMPSKSSFICANHFLDGKPSDDSGSPDYIPSKNMPSKKPKTEKDKKRFERLANRGKKDDQNASGQRNDSDQVKRFSNLLFKSYVPLQRYLLTGKAKPAFLAELAGPVTKYLRRGKYGLE